MVKQISTSKKRGRKTSFQTKGSPAGMSRRKTPRKKLGLADNPPSKKSSIRNKPRASIEHELAQRTAELAIINSIQQGLASRLDMQVIYDLVGEKIHEVFEAQDSFIETYDKTTDMLSMRFMIERGKRLPKVEPEPLSETPMRRWVIQNKKPLVIDHDFEKRMVEEFKTTPLPTMMGWPKSGVIMPVLLREDVIGIVGITNYDREYAFTDLDVRLLQTLVNSMSVALENARLFDETQHLLKETKQRNAELEIIKSVQEGLASKLEIQAIYDLVGDKLREIFTEHDVTINTYDQEKRLKHYHYSTDRGRRDPIASRPMNSSDDYFIRLRGPRLINENFANIIAAQFPDVQPYFGDFPLSYLSAPLMRGVDVNGYISLQNMDRENAFSDSDIRLLQTLANSMSVALENARLWAQEKTYRKALERELEIGREIQIGFLPEALPQAQGWEIAASLMSAREVAGDFYDAFELPDGNIGLVIADVCDKGVGAALFMTLFRSLIRINANQEYFERTEQTKGRLSIGERITRAMLLTNNYIAESHERSGMFATLFFGILDPRNGQLTYANGGHEPPLIIRSGTVREALHKTGPAVGIIPNSKFGLLEAQLLEEEMLLAYTDGVPDCKNPEDEFFGRERLLDIVHRKSTSSNELVKSVEAELRQYINGATQFDDITLLAVKRARRDLT